MKKQSIQENIDAARKSVSEWPEWMKNAAYFSVPGICDHPHMKVKRFPDRQVCTQCGRGKLWNWR